MDTSTCKRTEDEEEEEEEEEKEEEEEEEDEDEDEEEEEDEGWGMGGGGETGALHVNVHMIGVRTPHTIPHHTYHALRWCPIWCHILEYDVIGI
jgi:hypothetical protein